MREPLVSVVVPIFNVEPFLRRCLDSIISQSYSSIEIILVDDGSPDMCGLICDKYVEEYPQISVIHQKNSGVSRARNVGIDHANGQLVTFIDPDDWIDADHIKNLVIGIKNSDCCICEYWIEGEKKLSHKGVKRDEKISADVAIERLLSPVGFQGYVFNKLFLSSILRKNSIYFYQDIQYMEDLKFCADYFSVCQSIACIASATYHYRQHSESAVGAVAVSKEWLQKRATAMLALDSIKNESPSRAVAQLCDARKQTEYMEILLRVVKAGTMHEERNQLLFLMRTGMSKLLFSNLPINIKLKYVSVAIEPTLYCKISENWGRKKNCLIT